MKDAKYGRLEINCPICGSLKQVKIDDVDPALVFKCNGCHEKFRVRFALPEIACAKCGCGPDCRCTSEKLDDALQRAKDDELAEKTATRVTPKSMSKRNKAASREKR